jgi:hypothetical protein
MEPLSLSLGGRRFSALSDLISLFANSRELRHDNAPALRPTSAQQLCVEEMTHAL